METLIKMVADKTGISHDQAATAVNTVIHFLKDKLPPGMAENIEGFINGGDTGGLGDIAGKLGDIFNK